MPALNLLTKFELQRNIENFLDLKESKKIKNYISFKDYEDKKRKIFICENIQNNFIVKNEMFIKFERKFFSLYQKNEWIIKILISIEKWLEFSIQDLKNEWEKGKIKNGKKLFDFRT